MWWNKKEKFNQKEVKDDLTVFLESVLLQTATDLGLELELAPVDKVFETLLTHVWRTGNFGFMQGNFGLKAWMIVGKSGGKEPGAIRAGYIMEYRNDKRNPIADQVIVGGMGDGMERSSPLFISVSEDGTKFGIGHSARDYTIYQDMTQDQLLENPRLASKLTEIMALIQGGLDEGPGSLKVKAASGSDPFGLERRLKTVEALTDELEQLTSSHADAPVPFVETLKIKELPDDLPVEVVELFRVGIDKFSELGGTSDGFVWGEAYEDPRKKKTIWWIRKGDRDEGEFLIQVENKSGEKDFDLSVGLVKNFQMGRLVPMTAAAYLCYENGKSRVSSESVVEVWVYPTGEPARFTRKDFSALDGHFQGELSAKAHPHAQKAMAQVFSGHHFTFESALAALLS